MSFLITSRPENPRPDEDTRPTGIRFSPQAQRQLERLQLSGSRDLRGLRIGQRTSHRRKPAPDFREHRAYVPGDDVRYVDWHASARHEQFFIKQGELPKEVIIHLLLDCSASMAWGKPSKRRAQLQLALGLAYLTLAHGDRLMIYPLGGNNNQPLGPISGKGQLTLVVKYLESLRYGGAADFGREFKRFGFRAGRGGLLFLLSDLLGLPSLDPLLDVLPAPTWKTTVFHTLHPDELSPDLSGGLELIDSESGERYNVDITPKALQEYQQRLTDWQNQLDMECVEHRALYTIIPTNWSLETGMIAHLRETKVVAPL